MQPDIEVVTVSSHILALTTGDVMTRPEIPVRIRGLFDTVYAWLRDAPVSQAGHNYALYDQITTESLRLRVGFPVTGPFANTERVQCVHLAPGRAARAVHIGPYSELHRTYAVLHAWCSEHALPLNGESWEVYGDWTDDSSKLTTELYLRIRIPE